MSAVLAFYFINPLKRFFAAVSDVRSEILTFCPQGSKSLCRCTTYRERAYPTLLFAFIGVRSVWSHMDFIRG